MYGGNILNLPIKHRGDVLIVGAEDGPDIIHHRIHALGSHYDTQELRKAIAEGVRIIPTVGDDIDVENTARQNEVIEAGRGCRLIVLDTIARYHTADENVAADAKRIMHALEHIAQATESAVVFLHHSSKAAALSGAGDTQQASKGSAVWTDHGRWTLNLIGMTKDEAELFGMHNDDRKKYVRCSISKQNYGPPMPDIWYIRGNGGVLLPVHLEKQPKPQRRTGSVANADDYRSRARGG
jgi:RecA-family ATPase